MTKRKYITVKESESRYARAVGLNLSENARRLLNQCQRNDQSFPEQGTRRRQGETKRTSVMVTEEQISFIDEQNVNLSHLLQDWLQSQIEQEYHLARVEDNPGYGFSESELVGTAAAPDGDHITREEFGNKRRELGLSGPISGP